MLGNRYGARIPALLAILGLLAALALVGARGRRPPLVSREAGPRPEGQRRRVASLAGGWVPAWVGLALLTAAVGASFLAYQAEPRLHSPAVAEAGTPTSWGGAEMAFEVERLVQMGAAYAAAPNLSGPPEPPQPELSPAMAQLRGELEALVRSLEGPDRAQADIAVAVVDLQSGEGISVDGGELHLAGCTIKIFPALEALRDVEDGNLDFDGSLDYLIQQTVRVSDNSDSRLLLYLAGLAETNAFMTEVIGTKGSIITHAPGYYGEDAADGVVEMDNYLTADDLALTFSKLYRGELVAPELSSYLLDVMTQSWLTPPEYGVILYQAAPWGARVSHKIGYVDPPSNVWNDAGVVMVDTAEGTIAYAVAILTQYNSDYEDGPPIARQIAERIFQHFNETYGLGY